MSVIATIKQEHVRDTMMIQQNAIVNLMKLKEV
jgi:hypothetical protein